MVLAVVEEGVAVLLAAVVLAAGVMASAGEGGEEVTLVGPKGEIKKHCAIVAHRHIHLSDGEAKNLNLKEGELVSVRVDGTRPITFHQVLIRVDPSFVLNMHLDTDEANAAGIDKMSEGKIIK